MHSIVHEGLPTWVACDCPSHGIPTAAMDSDDFDRVTTALDSAMVVVTTAAGDERAGCLVGFHTQVSIVPRRYAVWLSKANHTFRVALLARQLAVHALTNDDGDLAELFGTQSGDDVDKFAACEWRPLDDGLPRLTACRAGMVLRRTGLFDDGGDHVCFVGAPVDAWGDGPFEPLRLSDVGDLDAGHDVDERPVPPTERAG